MPSLRSASMIVCASAAVSLPISAHGAHPLFPIELYPINHVNHVLRSVALDVNADGRPDIVTPGSGMLNIQHRLADGTYDAPVLASNAPTPTFGNLSIGDIDGDGDADLVQAGLGSIWVYRNTGSGTFGPAEIDIYSTPGASGATQLDDFDGDGDLDIFVVAGGELRVLINAGLATGTFPSTEVAATFSAAYGSFMLIDADGDGDRDAVGMSTTLQFAERVSTGAFGATISFALPGFPQNDSTIAWGDIDGDGDVDATIGLQGRQIGILKGDGEGGYGPMLIHALAASPGSGTGTDLAMEDVDGDGDLDIAGIGMCGSDIYVLPNNGSGDFGAFQYISGPGKGQRLSFADTDGDGDRDAIVYVRSASTSFIGIIERVSAAKFRTPQATDIVVGGFARVGDFDCDGDVDVFTFNRETLSPGPGGTRWLVNDGSGNLATRTPWQQAGNNATAATGELNSICGDDGVMAFFWDVGLGDVDGDGDVDRVDISNNLDMLSVRYNDGTGFFPNVPDNYLQGSRISAVSVADLNGDDAPDIVFARCGEIGEDGWNCAEAAAIGVMLNDGTGLFGAPVFTPCVGAAELIVRDLNDDDAPDVIVANSAVGHPYTVADNALTVLLNDGFGVLTTHSSHQEIGVDPRDIALGYVDDDALIDAVVVCVTSGNIAVLIGDPVTMFAPPVLFAAGGDGVSVDLADMDGDGDQDIVVGRSFRGPMVLENLRLSPAPPACAGDVNGDGSANAADFTILAASFGTPSGATRAQGDLTGDGAVNAADFVILAGDFGCQAAD